MQDLPDASHVCALADRLNGERSAAKRRSEGIREEIAQLQAETEQLTLVSALFKTLIDKEVAVGVRNAERLITRGLQAVFSDQDLAVEASVEESRGKVSAQFLTVQHFDDGTEIRGMGMDAFGGAVTTVESVLLRVFVMLRRNLRRFLVLDETMPALNANYSANMGQFLALICEKLDMNILLITHNPTMVESAHRAYRIHRRGDEARFELLRGGERA